MSKVILFFLFVPTMAFALPVSQLERELQQQPDNIVLREKISRAYSKHKKWNKVIELLNPNTEQVSPRGFLLLAKAYEELKDYKNSVRIFSLLAEKRPKDYQVQYLLADANLKLAATTKDIKQRQSIENEAISNLRQSIALKPRFKPAHQTLVNYFLKVNMSHEAREQFVDMIKVFGAKGEFHSELCRLYTQDGFLTQAIKYCELAIKLSPQQPENYVYLSQTYFDLKETEKSEKTIVAAAKKFPLSEFVQYGAGQYFLTTQNYPVASKYLQRAVQNNGQTARSRLAYANSLFHSGAAIEALPQFTKACELNQTSQDQFLSAASKLRLRGEAAIAQKYAQAANGCKK